MLQKSRLLARIAARQVYVCHNEKAAFAVHHELVVESHSKCMGAPTAHQSHLWQVNLHILPLPKESFREVALTTRLPLPLRSLTLPHHSLLVKVLPRHTSPSLFASSVLPFGRGCESGA